MTSTFGNDSEEATFCVENEGKDELCGRDDLKIENQDLFGASNELCHAHKSENHTGLLSTHRIRCRRLIPELSHLNNSSDDIKMLPNFCDDGKLCNMSRTTKR